MSTGNHPYSVTVDPSGHTAYVTNLGSDTVSQYRIDATGTLTPLSPPTVSTGTEPSSITVDPSGHTVYVMNRDSNTISQYSIDATGTLTPLSPPTVSTGMVPIRSPSTRADAPPMWRTKAVTRSRIIALAQPAPSRP